MADTELRLKINAAAARAGAKEFKSAIQSIQKVVSQLDRDTTGAFTGLRNQSKSAATSVSSEVSRIGKASDTAANRIKSMALASASAMRTSEQAAQRLALRMGDIGDAKGIAQLEQALTGLRSSLTSATSPLDVRSAKSQFDDLRSSLLQTTVAAEHLRGEQAMLARQTEEASHAAATHAAALERLAQRHDPLRAASKAYEQSLNEIQQLEDAGTLSASRTAAARERAASSLLTAGSAADVYASKARVAAHASQNLAYQFNDIGVMLAAGQSPLLLAAQQGTQISQALQMMGNKASILATLRAGFMSFLSPVTLATVGIIAGGAALVQWGLSAVGATEDAKTFATQQESLSKLSTEVGGTLDILQMNLVQLTDKYGAAAIEVRNLAIAQAELRRGDLRDILREQIDQLGFIATRYEQAYGAAGLYSNGLTNIANDFDITRAKAKQLEPALMSLAKAPGWEEQKAALQNLITRANDLGVSLSKFPPEVRAAANAMIDFNSENAEVERLLQQAANALTDATGQTNAWAGAMAGVRAEIDAIASSLASIGGGMVSNAGKQAELAALNAGKTVQQAAAARALAQKQLEWDARSQGASWIERQLIDAEKYQFNQGQDLDAQIDAARAKARKAASSSGGSSRVQTLGDESKALERLAGDLNRRTFALGQENDALRILIDGQTETMEGARLLAAAQRLGMSATDETTMAMVRQYDAAVQLNEQLQRLAKDPVKDWLASVPTWREAGQQIESEVLGSLSDAIANFAQTGRFDFESLGNAILATATNIMAQRAVLELVELLGGNTSSSGGGSGGFGLGDLIGSFFAKEGGLTSSPTAVNAGPILSPAAFRHAPHYAEGTANTSGIPAMLHDNEAVIPLSRGRKVGVELNGAGAGGTVINMPQTFQINTPDADSFRRSKSQILQETGAATRKAMAKNG